jgi:cytoskeletal protein CcmA (bactofilin family)
MAQNYTRQSTFSDGDTITAALFNDEYNQLENAFNYSSSSLTSTGHRHDGTAGQGGNIPQIGDLDFLNKIVVDSTNNRWGFFVEVSSAAVEQIRIQDGAIVPVTDNDIDLGTSSLEFKDLYIDGTANIDTLSVDTSATIAGLTVSGTSTLQGDVYLGNASADTIFVPGLFQANLIPENDSLWNLGSTSLYWANAYIDAITTTGNVTIGGTLGVTGATTLSSTLGVTGATTLSSTLAVTGTSTLTGNVTATNDLSIGGNLTVTGNATISGNLTFGDADTDSITLTADVASHITPDVDDTYDLGSSTKEWRNLYIDGTANIDSLVADTADINGGTIDNSTIATSNITVGAGKTLNVSAGTLTLANDQISGDKVEGGTINATTINTLTFGSLNDGTITITAFVDEDNMVSNSATLVPTQQSVKAYVDSQVTAQDLDFQGDSGGALSIDLDSETLTIAGGTGIDTTGATNTLTVAIDSTVATLTGTQTFTNKTLTSAVLNTSVSGTAVLDEDDMASNSATQLITQQSAKAYIDSTATALAIALG